MGEVWCEWSFKSGVLSRNLGQNASGQNAGGQNAGENCIVGQNADLFREGVGQNAGHLKSCIQHNTNH